MLERMKCVSEELVVFKKMQQGDVSALEYFFQEYMEVLYYKALGYIHDSQAAEDIVQEVFIHFWENRNKIEITSSLLAYLSRAVVNRCKNYLEHLDVQHRYEEEFQAVYQEQEIQEYDEEELELLRQRLQIFIANLPKKCRDIFILACVEGLKYREVADRLHVSVNTVKTQVKVAYSKLRTEFDLKDRELLMFLLFIPFS